MEVQFVYQKKRSEFGRQCQFTNKGPDLIDNYPPNKKLARDYILRNPTHRSTQFAPIQAEHDLNTMRAEYKIGGVNHFEGGWPKDVNMNDEEQTKRYRRKIEKEEGYHPTMMQLCKTMESCILQNNAVNIYQQYFHDVEPTPLVERSSARTVNVFKDQSFPTRPITHISWSPDNQTKLAISHCNLDYQAIIPNQTTHSYIWEISNPNKPLLVLRPQHPTVCLEYHQKDPNSLVSGQFNGQVAVWDTRKGYEPVELSVRECSFRNPVLNVLWIHSKSGTEFFSSSTDGQVKWWDIRKLNEPLETLIIDPVREEDQSLSNAMGASCLEYEMTIPTRFMIGTENGVVISCNRKGKTPLEKMGFRYNAHFGPILALQRNPAFVKNFLTIGDWTAKIFSEDCRESPIMWTNYHKAMLTDGAWSPTRLSVFFTTKSDGTLDVWDILQQQKCASLSVKVCDEPLRAIRTHDLGRLVAVGNQNGSTYLVEFSENLSISNKNDKMLLTAMFERETRREKILEARNRELRLKKKTASATNVQEGGEGGEHEKIEKKSSDFTIQFSDSNIQTVENEFNLCVNPPPPPPEEPPSTEKEPELVDEPALEESSPSPPTQSDDEVTKGKTKKGKVKIKGGKKGKKK